MLFIYPLMKFKIVNHHNLVDRICKYSVRLDVWFQKFECPLDTGSGYKKCSYETTEL
jgi:hypothetical protein